MVNMFYALYVWTMFFFLSYTKLQSALDLQFYNNHKNKEKATQKGKKFEWQNKYKA